MKEIYNRPSIQQLKRWCKDQDRVNFKVNAFETVKNALILNVLSIPFDNHENQVGIEVLVNHDSESCPRKETYRLASISSFEISKKAPSMLVTSENFSKEDIILRFYNASKYVNKKLLISRSNFFRNLLKNKEKQLYAGKFLSWAFKNNQTITINVDHLFTNEKTLNLLLFLLDKRDIDDFIHTPQDALALLELTNKDLLRESETELKKIENQIKNKFFELIGNGVPYVSSGALGKTAQTFIENLQQELVAYCKRDNTQASLNLLNYCSQIPKNNILKMDARTGLAFRQALRLLIFCNFKISTLMTRGIEPQLFTDVDLSPLQLQILKILPDYSSVRNFNTDPLFKMIKNTKTLGVVQIGEPTSPKNLKESYLCCAESDKHKRPETGYFFAPDALPQFNSLKPDIKPFYEAAAFKCFFSKYLPLQQSRFLMEFLTLDDLEGIRQASHEVYEEVRNSMSAR